MSNLQRKLDLVIANVNKRLLSKQDLIPKKTAEGILVGDVLIVSNDSYKDLYRKGELVYSGIHLNKCAIKMANLIAINYFNYQLKVKEIYEADQRFGNALREYQFFKDKYQKALESSRAEILLARLCYAKDQTNYYKKKAISLAN